MTSNKEFDILAVRDYYPSINNPSSSTWVYNQVLALQEFGYRPLVISPTPINPLKHLFKKKFRLYDAPSKTVETYKSTFVIRPPYFKVPNNKLKGLSLHNLSQCILKNGNIKGVKLIHAHFGQNGYASLALKRKLKVPLITSFYGYDSGRLGEVFKPYYKELATEGEMFLALSQDMKNDLIKLGFPEEKIVIHHLGVDLNKFTLADDIDKDFIQLLTVARLDDVKGVQYVIEALKMLFTQYPEQQKIVRYNIIGGGNYEKILKELVKKYKLENNIIFINNLIQPNSREIVLKQMQNCDIFLLCSFLPPNGAKEGTPVVLIEAQACGKACIATKHAGIPEIIMDNKTGFLVEEKNTEAIMNAIIKLVIDKELRKKFSLNAREKMQDEFCNVKQMQKLNILYEKLK